MPIWPLALALLPACARSPDLVLVTIDTTRRDAVGAYGGPSTPGIDGLAAEGVRYAEARTTVPLTIPAHASLLTGRWPTSTGLHDNSDLRLPASEHTAAEILSEQGYDTGAAVGAQILGAGSGFEQGFAWFDGPSTPERRADAVVDKALGWLATDHHDHPVFLWVHLYDPHAPYDPPAGFGPAADPYLGEVAFADSQIARLLAALRARPEWGHTGIVIVADHGEGRGDHGEREHGALAFASTTAVPLIAHAPGETLARVEKNPVSTIGILPTMLSWAGVALPDTVDGHVLDEPASPVYVESEYLAHHLGWSPIHAAVDGKGTLVQTTRVRRYDPTDNPLASPTLGPPPAFLAHFSPPSSPVPANASTPPGATTSVMLQSLGYLDATAPGRHANIDPIDGIAAYEAIKDVGRALAEGDEQTAAAGLATLRATDPDGPMTRLLAVGLQSRHDPEGALPEARAIALAWPSPEARATLGELLAHTGRLKEAAPYLAEAATELPPTPGQMGLLGLALAENGDPKAADWLERSLSAKPDQPLLRAALGRIALKAAAWDEAETWFQQEIQRYPPAVDARKSLVEALLALQRWNEALVALDELDAVRPPDGGSEFGRALALHHLHDAAGASRALARCLKRPSPPAACTSAAKGTW